MPDKPAELIGFPTSHPDLLGVDLIQPYASMTASAIIPDRSSGEATRPDPAFGFEPAS